MELRFNLRIVQKAYPVLTDVLLQLVVGLAQVDPLNLRLGSEVAHSSDQQRDVPGDGEL